MALQGRLNGKQKAAVLLVTLGPDRAAEVFKYLREDEIEQLTLEIANISRVTKEEKQNVIEEFHQMCVAQEYISHGGIDYAKEVLEKALGSQKALEIINRLTSTLQVRPFEFIRKTEPAQLMNFIQNEHSQTIALIMAYLRPEQSSVIISTLPPEKQIDIARRIATMDRTSPDIIHDVERVLEKQLSSLVTMDYTSAGGIQNVVDILNCVDRGTEKNILEALEEQDPELAEEIKRRMFVFEDILTLDNRSIQRVIREVDNKELALALKGSSQEVAEIIYKNMSTRMADMIREDIEYMGPVRLRDVEEAQQKIVNIIRKLEETGEIIISRGGGDEIIV